MYQCEGKETNVVYHLVSVILLFHQYWIAIQLENNIHYSTSDDATNNFPSRHRLIPTISSELIDTFFIVVHKKPLIFLHWYHHITVLLYCYHSYVTTSPPGIFFVVMNYSVHASMYGYYFLMAIKMRPKWFNPIVITIFQISQMIVGVAVTLAGFYYYKTDPTCGIEKENNTAAFVMYGSYLFLFLQFFFGRYSKTKGSKKQKSV